MTLFKAAPNHKVLLLGTALWGWGINRTEAHQLLDRFITLGGTSVDTAVNYPINQRPEDFGLAARWLTEWLSVNGSKTAEILFKVGAEDNMGSPNTNLSSAHLRTTITQAQQSFGAALTTLAIHWDNRGLVQDTHTDDEAAITETLAVMSALHRSGLAIGFSGVKNPQLYRQLAPDLAAHWLIQVKENAQTCAARQYYQPLFPEARYLAYGINMGGLKAPMAVSKNITAASDNTSDNNSSVSLRGLNHPTRLSEQLTEFINSAHQLVPAPKDFNELALLIAYLNPELSGIIIGPRNLTQLESSMNYWQRLLKESEPISMAARNKLMGLVQQLQTPA